MRWQEWWDGELDEDERSAFEDELAGDTHKAVIARKLKLIDDGLKRLNEHVEHEAVPDRLLSVINRKMS